METSVDQSQIAFSIKQTASALQCSRTTLCKLISEGEIVTYRVGARVYVTPQAIINFQQSHEVILTDAEIRSNKAKWKRLQTKRATKSKRGTK